MSHNLFRKTFLSNGGVCVYVCVTVRQCYMPDVGKCFVLNFICMDNHIFECEIQILWLYMLKLYLSKSTMFGKSWPWRIICINYNSLSVTVYSWIVISVAIIAHDNTYLRRGSLKLVFFFLFLTHKNNSFFMWNSTPHVNLLINKLKTT